MKCGMPYACLGDSIAAAHMPQHEDLSYWNAIRRFFADMGLPAIAEVPDVRVGLTEHEYYVTLMARCLEHTLRESSFICADHLTALVLPLVNNAICGRPVKKLFFFTHPLREIATLMQRGQAPQLSEFIWRNTVTAAIKHAGRQINFVETDSLGPQGASALCRRILEFYGASPDLAENCPLPIPEPMPPTGHFSISSHTLQLYEALHAHVAENSWDLLESIAQQAWDTQTEQNGWQFVNCLDCGELSTHARLLLANDPGADACDVNNMPDINPDMEDEKMWLQLLDASEQKLLQARREYAARLFLNADSLSHFYMNELHDLRALSQNACPVSSKNRKSAKSGGIPGGRRPKRRPR